MDWLKDKQKEVASVLDGKVGALKEVEVDGVATPVITLPPTAVLKKMYPDLDVDKIIGKDPVLSKIDSKWKSLLKTIGATAAALVAAEAAYNLARGYFHKYLYSNAQLEELDVTRNIGRKYGLIYSENDFIRSLKNKLGPGAALVKIRAISVPIIDTAYTIVGVNAALEEKEFNAIKLILDKAFKKMRVFSESKLILDLSASPVIEPRQVLHYDEDGWLDNLTSVITASFLLPKQWLSVEDIALIITYLNY